MRRAHVQRGKLGPFPSVLGRTKRQPWGPVAKPSRAMMALPVLGKSSAELAGAPGASMRDMESACQNPVGGTPGKNSGRIHLFSTWLPLPIGHLRGQIPLPTRRGKVVVPRPGRRAPTRRSVTRACPTEVGKSLLRSAPVSFRPRSVGFG